MAQAIAKSEWAHYCDNISKALESSDAEIEVSSLELGDQPESDWLPFIGITYDANDDIIDIALEGLDHIISHPKEIRAEMDGVGLQAIEIKDSDGVQHIVKLRDSLALPAPH
jgi:Family of unknown function (DUF5335)